MTLAGTHYAEARVRVDQAPPSDWDGYHNTPQHGHALVHGTQHGHLDLVAEEPSRANTNATKTEN